MPFKLPEEMPTGTEDLAALRAEAQTELDAVRAAVRDGSVLSDEELADLRVLAESITALDSALAVSEAADAARQEEIDALLGGDEDEEDESTDEAVEEDAPVEEVVEEAEAIIEQAAGKELIAAGTKAPAKRTSYTGLQKGKKPAIPRGTMNTDNVGFEMVPGTRGYKTGFVGYRHLAESIDSVRSNHRPRANRDDRGSYAAQALFTLTRSVEMVDDSHELVAAIEKATDVSNMRAPQYDESGSLVAAGGWCAPSEQLYDFCEVPVASDLIALPEITIRRGGVRWPVEPDLTAIFESFEFFFTEPQLEADPPPLKECVEIPCPDEFEEIRLNAVGYCVEAGILQTQGWPELIDWFMRSLTQEHFRALSRRTILDMVAGSTPVIIPTATQIAAGSSILNSLALMAMNLRLNKGLARTATIEGVAPSWLHEVVRADLANQQGVDTKNITDAQINGWLSARNISLQFVADWQTRGVGQPGNLATVEYPGSVQIMLYPAGTWFRALSNVIEFGVLYPRELLQINRYTRFFTEDAYAVGKRCNESLVVTVPICPNGAYGEQDAPTCNTPGNEVQAAAITGTAPTGGTFTLTWNGQTTAPIAYNATAAAVKTALDGLSNLEVGDTTTAGGPLPGTAVSVTFQGRYAGGDQPKMTIDGSALTGGDETTLPVVVVTAEGGV
jgi:hypothetical protein